MSENRRKVMVEGPICSSLGGRLGGMGWQSKDLNNGPIFFMIEHFYCTSVMWKLIIASTRKQGLKDQHHNLPFNRSVLRKPERWDHPPLVLDTSKAINVNHLKVGEIGEPAMYRINDHLENDKNHICKNMADHYTLREAQLTSTIYSLTSRIMQLIDEAAKGMLKGQLLEQLANFDLSNNTPP